MCPSRWQKPTLLAGALAISLEKPSVLLRQSYSPISIRAVSLEMLQSKRTVFITGCSDDSLGSGLAVAFHNHGFRVLATARSHSKMTTLHRLGIETLTLDVLSDSSIKACLTEVTSLTTETGGVDVLVNNAGGGYNMPVADIDLAKAKALFDLNVWSYITVTQAFLPLLIRAKGMIVNNTSISSVAPTPFSSVYHASKAAAAMFSDHQRIELAPFGIRVVDLKTGCVKSNFHRNRSDESRLPEGSIYELMRAEAERAIRAEHFSERMDVDVWAEQVVSDLSRKDPPAQVWRGTEAWGTWFWGTFAGHSWFDGAYGRMVGLDVLERRLKGLQHQ